jgi:hypothetical protein
LYPFSPIPCEHSLVRDSSFVNRFVEGIYLHAALTGPVIHMFDMHRKQEIVVKDFTSYLSEFSFKDPSCLTRPGYRAVEIQKIHQEDPILVLSPALDLLASPAEKTPQSFISSRDRVLDTPLTSLSELDLVRTLLNSGYPVILLPTYVKFAQIQDVAPGTGPMVVVGYKLQKLSSSKVTLWVRFTSPPEYVERPFRCTPKVSNQKRARDVVPILACCVLSLLVTLRTQLSVILT